MGAGPDVGAALGPSLAIEWHEDRVRLSVTSHAVPLQGAQLVMPEPEIQWTDDLIDWQWTDEMGTRILDQVVLSPVDAISHAHSWIVELDASKAHRFFRLEQTIDLEGRDLSGIDLSGRNLWGANLSSADLSEANLADANLERATLIGTQLAGANLTDSRLKGARIDSVVLTDAVLAGVDFEGARLGFSLGNQDSIGVDFAGLDLSGARFLGANFGLGVLFERADLHGTSQAPETGVSDSGTGRG